MSKLANTEGLHVVTDGKPAGVASGPESTDASHSRPDTCKARAALTCWDLDQSALSDRSHHGGIDDGNRLF